MLAVAMSCQSAHPSRLGSSSAGWSLLARNLSPIDVSPTMTDDLSQLLLESRPRLLRYLRGFGAGDEAEDLVQELWLKAVASAPPEGPSLSYLMRMANNLMIDRARSARSRRLREETYWKDGPEASGEADETPDAERMLISRERLERVELILLSLGPRTESILRRHRIDDVPHREIAAEFGISVSAVEKQLQKAYRALISADMRHQKESVSADGGPHHD